MRDVLEEFDRYLKKRNFAFRGTVIGGAALIVMGVIDRATNDVDCLEPTLPEDIKKAASEFRSVYKGKGAPLKEEWLNKAQQASFETCLRAGRSGEYRSLEASA